MMSHSYKGVIEGGRIALSPDAALPADGSVVRVQLVDDAQRPVDPLDDPVPELAPGMDLQNLKVNADFFLYGNPKR